MFILISPLVFFFVIIPVVWYGSVILKAWRGMRERDSLYLEMSTKYGLIFENAQQLEYGPFSARTLVGLFFRKGEVVLRRIRGNIEGRSVSIQDKLAPGRFIVEYLWYIASPNTIHSWSFDITSVHTTVVTTDRERFLPFTGMDAGDSIGRPQLANNHEIEAILKTVAEAKYVPFPQRGPEAAQSLISLKRYNTTLLLLLAVVLAVSIVVQIFG